MPERLTRIIQLFKDRWDALDRSQKTKQIAAVLVILLALGTTVFLYGRTRYTVQLTQLTGTQIMQIENLLNEAGIKNRRIQGGSAIEVDETRLADVKIIVEASTITNATSFTFSDALSASGMDTTESVKREALRRAKEYELSQAIQGFDGVSLATVHLIIPEPNQSPVAGNDKSSASVLVEATRDLTPSEGFAIASYVCRSVEGLEMEHIEIYEKRYITLYSGVQDAPGTGIGSAEAQVQ